MYAIPRIYAWQVLMLVIPYGVNLEGDNWGLGEKKQNAEVSPSVAGIRHRPVSALTVVSIASRQHRKDGIVALTAWSPDRIIHAWGATALAQC